MTNEKDVLDEYKQFFDQENERQEETKPVEQRTMMQNNTKEGIFNVEQKEYISNQFFAKLESLGVNLVELKPYILQKGNMLGLSVAGSGKTTALVLKIIHERLIGDAFSIKDYETAQGVVQSVVPSQILITTFLKTGADEIRVSMKEWVTKLGIKDFDFNGISFATIHSEVLRVLKALGYTPSLEVNMHKYVKAVAEELNIRNITSRSMRITFDEVNDIASIFSFARNVLDDSRYSHKLLEEYGLDAFKLDVALSRFKEMKTASGVVDFEDLQEILYQGMQSNRQVLDFVRNQYDYVYIDEFQDTSQLQYLILKEYMQGAKNVCVNGDDDQAIYRFRGSDLNIILTRFSQDFEANIRTLSYNYRCGSNILNFVKPSLTHNTNRYEKELKAYNDGGLVRVVESSDVDLLLNSVRKDKEEGKSVGIIARKNADLLIPAIILELEEEYEFNLSKSVNMDNPIVKQLIKPMDIVTKRISDNFSTVFNSLLPRNKVYEAENLTRVLRSNPRYSIYNIPMDDIKASVPTLAPFISGLRKANEIDKINAYIYILGYMEMNVYEKDTSYNRSAKKMIGFIQDLIFTHPKLKNADMMTIEHIFNVSLPERMRRRREYSKRADMKLTTVHEAKGKEWDSVYIWNNTEGSFPNEVGNRESTQEEIEEERRVHYIACTRAKQVLTIFTKRGEQGKFLLECDSSYIDKESAMTPVVEMEEERVVMFRQPNKIENGDVQSVIKSSFEHQYKQYKNDFDSYLTEVMIDYQVEDDPEKLELLIMVTALMDLEKTPDEVLESYLKGYATKHFELGNLEDINNESSDSDVKSVYYKDLITSIYNDNNGL